jgi:hypothetical protein
VAVGELVGERGRRVCDMTTLAASSECWLGFGRHCEKWSVCFSMCWRHVEQCEVRIQDRDSQEWLVKFRFMTTYIHEEFRVKT